MNISLASGFLYKINIRTSLGTSSDEITESLVNGQRYPPENFKSSFAGPNTKLSFEL
jgi:hypothetical protein